MSATLKGLPAPVLAPALGTRVARLLSGLLLAGLLFGATIWNSELYDLLDAGWRWGTTILGLKQPDSNSLQQGGGVGQLMHHAHSVPAVLAFGALYLAISIALQWVLLPQRSQRQLVGWFYGGACAAVVILLLASQLGGAAFALLNKQLVHFIVSPLPVILLVPLLRWYLPARTLEA